MAKFNVMINRTRTIESSVEIEVSAKDEEAAQEKAEQQITKAMEAGKLDSYEWEETSDEDEFDYDVTEG